MPWVPTRPEIKNDCAGEGQHQITPRFSGFKRSSTPPDDISRSGHEALYIHSLDTTYRLAVSFTFRLLCSQVKKPSYPLDREI
jgi:hypothetical protein